LQLEVFAEYIALVHYDVMRQGPFIPQLAWIWASAGRVWWHNLCQRAEMLDLPKRKKGEIRITDRSIHRIKNRYWTESYL